MFIGFQRQENAWKSTANDARAESWMAAELHVIDSWTINVHGSIHAAACTQSLAYMMSAYFDEWRAEHDGVHHELVQLMHNNV